MSIKAIDEGTVHRLTSGQVVVDLQTAVKELLENALDAGATIIEIRFKEFGVDSIEVVDNGHGIEESNWQGIARKHHTSKLATFDDLTSVTTLGFRGEAIASLNTIADLSITTSSSSAAPVGYALTFDKNGNVVVGSKIARSKGTTVTVSEIFRYLPVRRKDLLKNAKREFGKAVNLIQAYALIKTRVRIDVKNTVKGKSTIHLQTSMSPTVRDNFSSIFAPKAHVTMMDLALELSVENEQSVFKRMEGQESGPTIIIARGLISLPNNSSGRMSSDRQFFNINGRPFNPPTKLVKTVNEVYRAFNPTSFPCVVLDFVLNPEAYDVNVSPDKRTIFLHNESNLCASLKMALEQAFLPTQLVYAMAGNNFESGMMKQKKPPSKSVAASVSDVEDDILSSDQRDNLEAGPRKRRRPSSIDTDDVDMSDNASDEEQAEEAVVRYSARPDFSNERQISSHPGEPENDDPSESDTDDYSLIDQKSTIPFQSDEIRTKSSGSPLAAIRSTSPSFTQNRLVQSKLYDHGISKTANTTVLIAPSRQSRKLTGVVSMIRQFKSPSHRSFDNLVEREYDETDEVVLAQNSDNTKSDSEYEELVVPGSLSEASDMDDDIQILPINPDDGENALEGSPTGIWSSNNLSPNAEEDSDSEVELERDLHLAALDSELALPSASKADNYNKSEITGQYLSKADKVRVNMNVIKAVWNRSPVGGQSSALRNCMSDDQLVGAALNQDAVVAEATLSRVVSKEDFLHMSIVGQFNLGFIIARRQSATLKGKGKEVQDDLFIIDQHATDEKYNFEKLQQETIIQSQRLLQPRILNLPSYDEITAMEHVDMLKMNGFEVVVDEDEVVGERVKLVAQPVSKGTEFNVEDLEELLDLITSTPAAGIVRPSKVRKMFASRACRKSVMIGRALNKNQMTAIVQHMSQMDQPWACPHGRPTMRWLAGLPKSRKPEARSDVNSILQSYS